MKRMRISKTVDVAVGEISTDVLAEELRRRVKAGERVPLETMRDLFEDGDDLDSAAWRFNRGDYEDALLHLERVLGNDFIGLAEILRRAA